MILVSWISIKVILPALPELNKVLNTSSANIQLSVSVFLLVFSLSRLVWGPVAHLHGITKTLSIAIYISIVGSVISMLSFNFPMYLAGRTLEGIGMGCIPIISMAIAPNIFEKKELSQKMAIVLGVASVMPAVSPIIGGYLMKFLEWRSIFGFLLLLSVILIFLSRIYLKHVSHIVIFKEHTIKAIFASYLRVISDRRFWAYMTPAALTSGALIGYYSASPYWFVDQMGFDIHIFSYFLLPTVGMYVVGSFLAPVFIDKLELRKLFVIIMLVLVAIVSLFISSSFMNFPKSILVITFMSLFAVAAGMLAILTNTAVLSHFKDISGIASAVTTCLMFFMSSVLSTIAMKLLATHMWPVMIYLGVVVLVGLLGFLLFIPGKQKT